MSTLYDISCIVFQDSLLPMNRSYEGVTSLSAVVCRRWSSHSEDGLNDYVVVTSDKAKEQGLDQHGIEWVKVSDPETSAIVELFVAYKVEEHTHSFLNLGEEGFKCTCGLEGTNPEAQREVAFAKCEAAQTKLDAANAKCEVTDAEYHAANAERYAAWDERDAAQAEYEATL